MKRQAAHLNPSVIQDSKATSSSAQLSSSVTSLPFTEDAPSIKQSSSRVVEKKTWKLKPDDQDLSDVFIGVMRAQDAGRRGTFLV